jgi:N-acetylmuramoyl-L-alanine amidase
MSEGFVYTAGQGDSTTRIAFRNGFFWKTVWEHPENSELKSKRKDPNILLPGDTVFIPERREGEGERAGRSRR